MIKGDHRDYSLRFISFQIFILHTLFSNEFSEYTWKSQRIALTWLAMLHVKLGLLLPLAYI